MLILLLVLQAEAQSRLQVITKNESNHLIQNVKVTLVQGESESTQVTGADGSTLFPAVANNEAYQLRFAHPVYSFDSKSGSLSSDTTENITGSGSLQTLSGHVLDGSLQPVADAELVLNGNIPVTVNSETGNFSIQLEYGSAYSLRISHEDMIFFKDSLEGTVKGDIERVFIGYDK